MPDWLIAVIIVAGADAAGFLAGWWMAEHSGPAVKIRPRRAGK